MPIIDISIIEVEILPAPTPKPSTSTTTRKTLAPRFPVDPNDPTLYAVRPTTPMNGASQYGNTPTTMVPSTSNNQLGNDKKFLIGVGSLSIVVMLGAILLCVFFKRPHQICAQMAAAAAGGVQGGAIGQSSANGLKSGYTPIPPNEFSPQVQHHQMREFESNNNGVGARVGTLVGSTQSLLRNGSGTIGNGNSASAVGFTDISGARFTTILAQGNGGTPRETIAISREAQQPKREFKEWYNSQEVTLLKEVTYAFPLTKFPIDHNAARVGHNRNGSALKVNSSASSNNGPVHLAIEHINNPQSVIVSQNQKQFGNPATLDKRVLEQNVQYANANEHYKSEETKDERYTNVGEEEYIMNALSKAITNKSPMKIYSKFFHEFVNMIQGDQPTVSKFKLNPGFKKYILENGIKTILELAEYDALKENHTEFFQKALGLYDEEVRLEKYKMAGNKLSDEEKEESLKNMIFEGTTE
uniref:RGS domain-containing protein n=1 Tax=Meloidogyne javanica TaxID=6303 RepID=A0A915LX25_MELJA